jgi:hypothetical protein
MVNGMQESPAVAERVIGELERVLGRPLTCEEIRLLLLARIIEEQAFDREAAFAMELELLKSQLVNAA